MDCSFLFISIVTRRQIVKENFAELQKLIILAKIEVFCYQNLDSIRIRRRLITFVLPQNKPSELWPRPITDASSLKRSGNRRFISTFAASKASTVCREETRVWRESEVSLVKCTGNDAAQRHSGSIYDMTAAWWMEEARHSQWYTSFFSR